MIEGFEPVDRGEVASPAADSVRRILVALGLPDTEQYDADTADSFEDVDERWLADEDRLRIEVLLQMLSPADIAAALDKPEQDVIKLFDLEEVMQLVDPSSG